MYFQTTRLIFCVVKYVFTVTGDTLLIPGFTSLGDHLDAVYDISIAYPYNFPQNEPELLKGNFPREVHFHIKRHPVESLPETDEELANWCIKVK